MELTHKYEVERSKWDDEAARRMMSMTQLPEGLTFQDYARDQSEMTGIADFLGDLNGKSVLEYGCGVGFISSLLARSGATVSAFDLSPMSINVAQKRAELNRVHIDFAVAAGENLPYADESFDVVFGKGILHHLEVNPGWAELYRILKKNGRAAFAEPMGMNPVLNFVREHVPYPHKNDHGADRPLNYDEIRGWGQRFQGFRYQEIQLLSMVERAFGFGHHFPRLRRFDDALLRSFPALRKYCRYVVLFMIK